MQMGRNEKWRRAVIGMSMAVGLMIGVYAAPASAQTEIPTADDMETTGQSGFPDGSESDDEEQSSSDQSGDDSGEGSSQEAEGEQASDEEDGAQTSDGASDQKKSADEQAGGEEKAGDEKAADKAEEEGDAEKRGEVVDRTESVTKSLEERGDSDRLGPSTWVQAGVNRVGAPGFAHMMSLVPRESNTYEVSFQGSGMAGYDVIRSRDLNQAVGGRLSLHGQFMKNFSANIAVGARNNVNNFGRPEAMLAQGDLDLELRGHYEPLSGVYVGGDLGVLVPTGFESAGPEFSATSLRPRVAGSFQIGRLVGMPEELPLTAHVNAAYKWDNTENLMPDGVEPTRVERFAHGISAYDAIKLGLGAEYDLPYVKPFAAWQVDIPVNGPDEACTGFNALNCPEQEGFASYPNVLSLGARAEPIERLGVHAGVDIGLTPRQAQGLPATPPYMVFAGVSWQIDPTPPVQRVERKIVETRRVAPKRYHLKGKVTDGETGEPIGEARVVYPDRDRSAQMTGEANGEFRSYGFEPETEVSMRISHPDYESTSMSKQVGESDAEFSVELKPKPRMAVVKGRVTDPDGEPVEGAKVKYTGPSTGSVTTDAAGQFTTEVEAGDYTVAVTAEDYQTAGKDIAPEVDATVQMEISLREKPDENLVQVEEEKINIEQKISFESGSATIKEESYAILNQVAATLFENPEIVEIEVQGHTDDVGEKEMNMELSQNRAESVKQYLMEQGVSAERLEAEGYGPTRPRVPNISAENRRLNRRVEFKIVERN